MGEQQTETKRQLPGEWFHFHMDMDLRPYFQRDRLATSLFSSPARDHRGYEWRVIAFPEGNTDSARRYLSLFIEVANVDQLPDEWQRHVQWEFELLDTRDSRVMLSCPNGPLEHVFDSPADYGYPRAFESRVLCEKLHADERPIRLRIRMRDAGTEDYFAFHCDLDLRSYYGKGPTGGTGGRPPSKLVSPGATDPQGYTWRMIANPDGATDTSRRFVSLFMQVANAESLLPFRRYVEWDFEMVDPSDPNSPVVECPEGPQEHPFNSAADWGYPKAFDRGVLKQVLHADERPVRLLVRVRDAEEMPLFQGRTTAQWKRWVTRPEGQGWCEKKQAEARRVVDWMIGHWGLPMLCAEEGVVEVGGEPGFLARELLLSGVPVTVIDPSFGISGKGNHYTDPVLNDPKYHQPMPSRGGRPMFRSIRRWFDQDFVAEETHRKLLENASCAIALYPDEGTEFFMYFSASQARTLPSALLPCDDCRQFWPEHDPTYEGFIRHIVNTDEQRLNSFPQEERHQLRKERFGGLPYSQVFLYRSQPGCQVRFQKSGKQQQQKPKQLPQLEAQQPPSSPQQQAQQQKQQPPPTLQQQQQQPPSSPQQQQQQKQQLQQLPPSSPQHQPLVQQQAIPAP